MSIPVFQKIEMVREAEKLSQPEICDRLEISLHSYKAMVKRGSASFEIIEKIANEWPQYAYWLLTGKTNPPLHIAPRAEDTDKALFDVIEMIDQSELLDGESFVNDKKLESVLILVEDTIVNTSMNVYLSVWIDELKNSVAQRYFAQPVISVCPRFDLWYNDYPGAARDFKRWCDARNINKFRLNFLKPGALSEISKSKLITSSNIQTEIECVELSKEIVENFNKWKVGEL